MHNEIGRSSADMDRAISTLSQQLQGLEATQQIYSRLQGLMLFLFL